MNPILWLNLLGYLDVSWAAKVRSSYDEISEYWNFTSQSVLNFTKRFICSHFGWQYDTTAKVFLSCLYFWFPHIHSLVIIWRATGERTTNSKLLSKNFHHTHNNAIKLRESFACKMRMLRFATLRSTESHKIMKYDNSTYARRTQRTNKMRKRLISSESNSQSQSTSGSCVIIISFKRRNNDDQSAI